VLVLVVRTMGARVRRGLGMSARRLGIGLRRTDLPRHLASAFRTQDHWTGRAQKNALHSKEVPIS
jgi:hypothetical protein